MRRAVLPIGMVLGVALAACSVVTVPREPRERDIGKTMLIDLVAPDGRKVTVQAEIARTPEEQQRGLMERTILAPDAGMLFVFSAEQNLSFWMKNTVIPLDILFFNTSGQFVSAVSMEPCPPTIDRCPVYSSTGPARFALEVPAGFIRAFSVREGWTLAPDDLEPVL